MMVLSMNVPMSKMMMIYVPKHNVRSVLHIMQFKKQQNIRKNELDN